MEPLIGKIEADRIQAFVDTPKTRGEIETLQKLAIRAVQAEMAPTQCGYFAGFLVKLKTLWRSPETVKNMILSRKIELNSTTIRWLTPEQITYLKQECDKRAPGEALLQTQLESVQTNIEQAIGNARSEKVQTALAIFFNNRNLCENAVKYPLVLNSRSEHRSLKDRIFWNGLKQEALRFERANDSLSTPIRDLFESCWMRPLQPGCALFKEINWTVYRGTLY